MKKAIVIGAGLAGLSAATLLASRGASVTVIEAAPQAGGRCRSYYDPAFDGVIDNGNHFVLTGNETTFRYLNRIGSAGAGQLVRDRLQGGVEIADPRRGRDLRHLRDHLRVVDRAERILIVQLRGEQL